MTFSNNCDSAAPYINVSLTRKCCYNCIHCVAKKIPETEDENIDVERIADTILSTGWQHVVIEGGEPMLYPDKVLMLISFIRPYIKDITMFTALPFNINNNSGFDQLSHIISELDGVNISIASTYSSLASQIMGQPLLDWRNNFIQKLAEKQDKFRVSFCLVKGLLDRSIQVRGELANLFNFGVKTVKINELTHCSDYFVGFRQIFPDLKLGNPISKGCASFITKEKQLPESLRGLNIDGRKIHIKRACSMVERSYVMQNDEKFKLIIRNVRDSIIGRKNYKVVYSNGDLHNSW